MTSTNFHTYYQGSEMVVAGQLPTYPSDKLEYEIIANQAGGTYSVSGSYNATDMVNTKEFNNVGVSILIIFILRYLSLNNNHLSLQASMYPEAITETIFDFVPKQTNTPIISVNFLERLWGKYI